MNIYQLNWGVPGKMPLFQGVRFGVSKPPLQLIVPKGEADYYLGWDLFAPRMRRREGEYLMSVVDNSVSLALVKTG